MHKKIICLFIGLAILTGALLACGSSDNTGSLSTPGATTAPAKHFKTGDVVKIGDTWQITINGLKSLTQDGDYHTPQTSGDVFLAIDITVKNISGKEQNISSLLNFSLKGSDGTKYNQAILTTMSAAPDGKIEGGEQSKGNLAYEVPGNVKAFVLSFEADIVASGQTEWDLSIQS